MDEFEKEILASMKQNREHYNATYNRASSFGDYLMSSFIRDDQYNHDRRRLEDAREDQKYYNSMNRNYNSRYSNKYKKSRKKKAYYKKRR